MARIEKSAFVDQKRTCLLLLRLREALDWMSNLALGTRIVRNLAIIITLMAIVFIQETSSSKRDLALDSFAVFGDLQEGALAQRGDDHARWFETPHLLEAADAGDGDGEILAASAAL
jgi:hypothetical protein